MSGPETELSIPFMHWGIIHPGPENFVVSSMYVPDADGLCPIERIPLKVWDNHSGIVVAHNGSSYPVPGKYTGSFTIVSPTRSQRPAELKEGPQKPERDILEAIINGDDHAILVSTEDISYRSSVFSVRPVKERIGSAAGTIINRYPPFVRVIDPEIERRVEEYSETDSRRIAKGVCLVAFPTKFYEQLGDMETEDLASVLSSLRLAIGESVEAAHESGNRYIPVSMFINTAKDTGRSLKRFHFQAYVDLTGDGHGSLTQRTLQAFEYDARNGGCRLCKRVMELDTPYSPGRFAERVLYQNDNWILWASGAPRVPYHLKFMPRQHIADITEMSREQIRDLADVLVLADNILNRAGVVQGKHVIFNQRPFDYGSSYHQFGEIRPNAVVGSFERMDDGSVIAKHPRYVARALREVIASYR
ncbi:MAG: hypothetical protein HY368_00435 [Candidatus Aenigmarchaeota archaeon]|nr:hypothetical protein [Candidatus Aenigmarchaeota archaeon]